MYDKHMPFTRLFTRPRTTAQFVTRVLLALALTWAIVWVAQAAAERYTFYKNEKVIAELTESITNQVDNVQLYNGNECTIVHQKFVNGPKSCHASTFMLKKVESQTEAEATMSKMQAIISKRVITSQPYFYETTTEWTSLFMSNRQKCFADYRYINAQNPENLQYSLNKSLPSEYNGLLVEITCSAPAKWSYYPMRS